MSLRYLVAQARRELERAGLPNADLDARVLACAAAGAQHIELISNGDAPVDDAAAARLERFVQRRLAREPVSRILGHREFWSLRLEVNEATLDPRADSETLVATVLELPAAMKFTRICDLGTGSGCLLVALLTQLESAHGVGVDICPDALMVARRNAMAHGLERRAMFVCADWMAPLTGRFGLIIANPPYIPSADIAALEPEVRCHDPARALDGGADGLDALRHIVTAAGDHMEPGGWLVVEVGAGQAGDVKGIMRAAGFRLDEAAPSIARDLAGIERCVCAQA